MLNRNPIRSLESDDELASEFEAAMDSADEAPLGKPIRIYALAKELTIDSKELLEITKKAGVTGKGSGLAMLTYEELMKVKSYLTGPRETKEGLVTSMHSEPLSDPAEVEKFASDTTKCQLSDQAVAKSTDVPNSNEPASTKDVDET